MLDGVISDEIFASEQDARVYLARLVEVVPTVSNVEAYARIIQEKHYLRSLIGTAREMIENARDPQNEAKNLLVRRNSGSLKSGRGGKAGVCSELMKLSSKPTTGCKSFPAPTGNSTWAFPPGLRCWIRSPQG